MDLVPTSILNDPKAMAKYAEDFHKDVLDVVKRVKLLQALHLFRASRWLYAETSIRQFMVPVSAGEEEKKNMAVSNEILTEVANKRLGDSQANMRTNAGRNLWKAAVGGLVVFAGVTIPFKYSESKFPPLEPDHSLAVDTWDETVRACQAVVGLTNAVIFENGTNPYEVLNGTAIEEMDFFMDHKTARNILIESFQEKPTTRWIDEEAPRNPIDSDGKTKLSDKEVEKNFKFQNVELLEDKANKIEQYHNKSRFMKWWDGKPRDLLGDEIPIDLKNTSIAGLRENAKANKEIWDAGYALKLRIVDVGKKFIVKNVQPEFQTEASRLIHESAMKVASKCLELDRCSNEAELLETMGGVFQEISRHSLLIQNGNDQRFNREHVALEEARWAISWYEWLADNMNLFKNSPGLHQWVVKTLAQYKAFLVSVFSYGATIDTGDWSLDYANMARFWGGAAPGLVLSFGFTWWFLSEHAKNAKKLPTAITNFRGVDWAQWFPWTARRRDRLALEAAIDWDEIVIWGDERGNKMIDIVSDVVYMISLIQSNFNWAPNSFFREHFGFDKDRKPMNKELLQKLANFLSHLTYGIKTWTLSNPDAPLEQTESIRSSMWWRLQEMATLNIILQVVFESKSKRIDYMESWMKYLKTYVRPPNIKFINDGKTITLESGAAVIKRVDIKKRVKSFVDPYHFDPELADFTKFFMGSIVLANNIIRGERREKMIRKVSREFFNFANDVEFQMAIEGPSGPRRMFKQMSIDGPSGLNQMVKGPTGVKRQLKLPGM